MKKIVTVLALAATMVTCPVAASATPTVPTCDIAGYLATELPKLGENPANWTIIQLDLGPGFVGEASLDYKTPVAQISPTVATHCDRLPSAVMHEHLHLEQARFFAPNDAVKAYRGNVEIVADCASLYAGSTYHPYVDRAPAGTCSTPNIDGPARGLLRFSNDRINATLLSDRM